MGDKSNQVTNQAKPGPADQGLGDRTGLNHRYLRPADLRRLTHSTFLSGRALAGIYSGKHLSLRRGQSLEFLDYRQYTPGDDLRHLDWKVLGRSDKLFVKLFEHQADLTAHLLIDSSNSMKFRGFAGQGESKYDTCCRIAAAIAFLIARQSDRFSLSFAQNGLRQAIRSANHVSSLVGMLSELESQTLQASAQLAESVRSLRSLAGKRALLVLFSDLLDESEPLLQQLQSWRQTGGEVIVFQVLHRDEMDLPAARGLVLVDSETGEKMRLDATTGRDSYRKRMQEFTNDWRSRCEQLALDYHLVECEADIAAILQAYFLRRAARWQARPRN